MRHELRQREISSSPSNIPRTSDFRLLVCRSVGWSVCNNFQKGGRVLEFLFINEINEKKSPIKVINSTDGLLVNWNFGNKVKFGSTSDQGN